MGCLLTENIEFKSILLRKVKKVEKTFFIFNSFRIVSIIKALSFYLVVTDTSTFFHKITGIDRMYYMCFIVQILL